MTETQWNKEIVRDLYRCAREDDLDRLLSYMHPKVVLDVPGRTIGGHFEGIDGMRSYFSRIRSVLGTGLVPQINSLMAEGSGVAVDLTLRGSLPDGEVLTMRVLSCYELQDRKIAHQTLFFDTEELTRRLGDRFREAAAA